MKNDDIQGMLIAKMGPRLKQFGLSRKDVTPDFDLVRTGFVNSMEFVELIAEFEQALGIEIDYEQALESEKFTSFAGIVNVFESHKNV